MENDEKIAELTAARESLAKVRAEVTEAASEAHFRKVVADYKAEVAKNGGIEYFYPE